MRLIDADSLYNGTMKDEYFRFKETDKSGREAFVYSCAMQRLVEAPAIQPDVPRVMALEELRGIHPVWDSNTPPYLWLDINRDCINVVSHWVAWRDIKEMIYGEYPKYDPDNYGKAWRCWTASPTDEQRKAVKWE